MVVAMKYLRGIIVFPLFAALIRAPLSHPLSRVQMYGRNEKGGGRTIKSPANPKSVPAMGYVGCALNFIVKEQLNRRER